MPVLAQNAAVVTNTCPPSLTRQCSNDLETIQPQPGCAASNLLVRTLSPLNGKTGITSGSITGIICALYVHARTAERKVNMPEDPLDAVYSYVERAYIRLQAGDLLIRCLDEGSAAAIQQMVESLVLAGPQNIVVLKEIMAEAGQRRSQLQDDLSQIVNEMEKSLKGYGVQLPASHSLRSTVRMSAVSFLKILREQGIVEESTQMECLQVLRNSKDLIKGLLASIRLLEDIERYLEDWLWGLAYQSTRQDPKVS